MKKLSKEGYLTLREGAEVIEADGYGDKVLLLVDGTYLKLFRLKRLISKALFFSYAQRFAKNALKLARLNIPTVSIIEFYRVSSIRRTAVHYTPLTGTTLRNLPHEIDTVLANKLGKFIRDLHDKGIYFRSLHFGNIVLTPENQLGLIDISDMKIYNKPLSEALRLRNFQHCSRYKHDTDQINKSIHHFIDGYRSKPDSPLCKASLAHIFKG